MQTLLEKLRRWIAAIQKALIGVVVIQSILVIIIGIASNKLTDHFDIWAWIILISSAFYIFIVGVMTIYQLKFPGSIVEELLAKKKLIEQEKFLDRQSAIHKYITKSIQALNEQTCSINDSGNKNVLCDQNLEIRLKQLLNTLVEYTDVILDTPNSKDFTIGLYLQDYYKRPDSINYLAKFESIGDLLFQEYDLIKDKGVLVLKDDLEIRENMLPKNLFDSQNAIDTEYEIQSAIKRCYNNHRFDKQDFSYMDERLSIICSEIPQVCSDESIIGVLFIISKEIKKVPSDIQEILKIYNRLISNYTSKYDECIINSIEALLGNKKSIVNTG